jgi:hypothetical protein
MMHQFECNGVNADPTTHCRRIRGRRNGQRRTQILNELTASRTRFLAQKAIIGSPGGELSAALTSAANRPLCYSSSAFRVIRLECCSD